MKSIVKYVAIFKKRRHQYLLLVAVRSVLRRIYTLVGMTKAKYWGVQFGRRFRVYGLIEILNMGRIEIGDNVRINSGIINVVGHYQKFVLLTGQEGRIVIGDNCGLSNCVIVSQDEVVIERDVYVGGGTRIYDNDFHSVELEVRLGVPSIIPSKRVVIGQGAFIGGHCTVLKGVKIGEKAVIGAGSVVSCNIPDGEVWAGVPARFIKQI